MGRAIGDATGAHLHELSWGRDDRSVLPHEPEKSISNEETFGTDVDDPEVIHAHLRALSDQVGGRLRRAGYVARTIAIKVRFSDFTTITRSRTLASPTDVGKELYDTSRMLYEALGLQRARIRLVGVKADGLIPVDEASRQLALGEPELGHREAPELCELGGRRDRQLV